MNKSQQHLGKNSSVNPILSTTRTKQTHPFFGVIGGRGALCDSRVNDTQHKNKFNRPAHAPSLFQLPTDARGSFPSDFSFSTILLLRIHVRMSRWQSRPRPRIRRCAVVCSAAAVLEAGPEAGPECCDAVLEGLSGEANHTMTSSRELLHNNDRLTQGMVCGVIIQPLSVLCATPAHLLYCCTARSIIAAGRRRRKQH